MNNIADDIASAYDEGFNDGVKSLLNKLKESDLGWYDWEEKSTVFTEEDIETIANQLIEKGRLGEVKNSSWIYDRLPTEEENENGLVGIVNGYNGKIRFTDAVMLVDYDFDSKEWWSQDYDLTDCKVECWFPVPAYHPTEK